MSPYTPVFEPDPSRSRALMRAARALLGGLLRRLTGRAEPMHSNGNRGDGPPDLDELAGCSAANRAGPVRARMAAAAVVARVFSPT
jgi:hypothetical protein